MTGSTIGHVGPDIDDIELNIQHNEITTTTETVAATSSSSTATTSATTISYCWQQTPSTCADDQPGIDDIEEEIDNAIAEVTIEAVTVINITNLDVEELVIVDVTLDEAMEMELEFEPEQTFEEAFNSIIEEAGMEEEFSDALAEENLTEEEFFNEVEEVMEEEMDATEVEPEIETETEIETEPEPTNEPTIEEDEEVMNTAGSEETMEAEVEEETTEEVEESDSIEEQPEEEIEETDVDEATVEEQVEDIQSSIERVIARVEANLTRIDLKLKATSFVLAKAMQDQQPDMSEYTSQSFYDPTQLPDNRDWYAEDTILDAYGRSVYQDANLDEYARNDPMAVYEEEINTTNENISRLEAELEELENELNE
jgi:hypothetical protein